jgi:hypothetical protein
VAAVSLRTYVFLDNLQHQLAGFIGTTARGFPPVGGVAAMFIETAPGLIINRITDVALKATAATPGIMVVERSFGLLEIHHRDQGQVLLAGQAVLDHLGLVEAERLRPHVVSEETVRIGPTTPRSSTACAGDMLIASESSSSQVEPAGYVAFAANESLGRRRSSRDDFRSLRPAYLRARGADRCGASGVAPRHRVAARPGLGVAVGLASACSVAGHAPT